MNTALGLWAVRVCVMLQPYDNCLDIFHTRERQRGEKRREGEKRGGEREGGREERDGGEERGREGEGGRELNESLCIICTLI